MQPRLLRVRKVRTGDSSGHSRKSQSSVEGHEVRRGGQEGLMTSGEEGEGEDEGKQDFVGQGLILLLNIGKHE